MKRNSVNGSSQRIFITWTKDVLITGEMLK